MKITSSYPGTAAFELHNCRGRLLGTPTFVEDLADPDLEADLHRILERACPSDPVRHGVICPSERQQLEAAPAAPAVRLALHRDQP